MRSSARLLVLRVMVVSILATLLGRLAYLQIAEGASYRQLASSNRVREVVTPAARGQVLDDMGRPLVTNRTALVVSVNRSIVRSQPHRGRLVLDRLAGVVRLSRAEIEQQITPCGDKLPDGRVASVKTGGCWNGSPYQPVPIVSYASDAPAEVERVLQIEEHQEDFPGIRAEYRAVREYPSRSLAAHVLGYLGPLSLDDLKRHPGYRALAPGTLIGRAGVEAVYDDRLRGRDGVQRLLVDKDSSVTGTLGTTSAVSGDNLVLSIDANVQRAAESALAQGIAQVRTQYDPGRHKKFTANRGAAIVVEAGTGRVVAMASYPSYDPTLFVGGISTRNYTRLSTTPGSPLISNAVQGLYAPGSTFKIVSTAGAVAAGYPLTARVYPCPSSFRIGQSVKHNFEGESFSTLDFRETLIRSCDTVYYRLAVEQWSRDGGNKPVAGAREVFARMARSWGFGRPTGIDLPDERAGLITDRAFKQAFWQKRRNDYCAGAKRRPKGSYLQLLDAEFCTDGWRYNAGDAANFVIGQGDVLVTPLQLAMAYGAMANGGTLYRPQLAKGLLSADGRSQTLLPPVPVGRLPVPRAVLDYMKRALGGVVRPPGTAKAAFAGFPLGQVPVGGKTGTADVQDKAPISWFASFAPVDGSKYVTMVMVPEGGTGGTTAAPIARKIWDALYGLEGTKPALRPGGALPAGLPVVMPDGSIGRPGSVLPRRPVVRVATPTPTSQAVGPGALPWAVDPRRRTGRSS